MPKRPAHHRVKQHLVYSVGEAAEVVGVHRQTVIRWIRINGLPAETERRPWLIRGADLKPWLIARRQNGKAPLADGRIRCLPCRGAKTPDGGMADYRPRTETTGLLIGLCPDCERLIHRIVRRADLGRIAANLDVTFT
jgi:excisionase family DNA binding protein